MQDYCCKGLTFHALITNVALVPQHWNGTQEWSNVISGYEKKGQRINVVFPKLGKFVSKVL